MNANENPADKAKADELYENREPKKIIRIITVTAYMISVSFVGIVLSAYYIFLWHPPNPRLMHAMAQEGHHERLVSGPEIGSGNQGPPAHSVAGDFAGVIQPRFSGPADDRVMDLLADRVDDEVETVKRRRQVVNNVNAFLSANFEKSQVRGIMGEETTVSSLPQNTSVEALESTTTASGESPETSEESTTSMSPPQLFPSAKRIRNSAKKQQQMPFALKHLEVPIQSDRLRKRSARISTSSDLPTSRNAYIPSDSKEGQAESGLGSAEAPQRAPRRHTIMQLPRKMSAHTVMASISRTLERARHSESKLAANEVKLAGEESKDRLYEPKHKQKLFRVLTVVAYIISVSLAAIVLSLYYMYIWDPSDHPHYVLVAKRTGNVSSASNTSVGVGAGGQAKMCNEAVASSDSGVGADGASRYETPQDEASPPTEPPDNTRSYAAVIGEQSNSPRQLGVMGLLKKLSINRPDLPRAQPKDFQLFEQSSDSPISNRALDEDEAATSELPDLVDD